MGRIVATEFVSVDGVFEDPGGAGTFKHGGWSFQFNRGEDGDAFKLEELRAADAQLLGRVTYEGFAAAWPDMEHSTGEFGEKMNGMPKYVVSKTLERADWNNSTILDGDLAADVATLKDRYAGDILIAGSGQLVRGLLAQGLLDELRLMIFPVVLGSGERLLGAADDLVRLSLGSTQTVGDGVVILTYRKA
ncbi:MAG TPA: dihydrofolate reductase family protein [Solirubrobacteraceae bacterium]|jgi:dihydrofolate reductase|nr:dihydrofolate reductase family protein [Solirubrobacteraceae bacterium]